jgi:hypothetical protein
MRRRGKSCIVLAAAALMLSLPWVYLLKAERRPAADEQGKVLSQYLKSVYARDFKQAYGFISAQDRALKSAEVYVSERGPFTGFTAEVAQKLAEWIDARPIERQQVNHRTRLKVRLSLPDANSVGPLLFEWDETRLNALPTSEQRKLLAELERLRANGRLKILQGDEEFVLVKEGKQWKVFLDWAAGTHVAFKSIVPEGGLIEAEPDIRETIARSGDLFTVTYRVKNRSEHPLSARIVHRVEPTDVAHHLDLVECALLLPVQIPPGQEETYASRYWLRGDLPEGAKRLEVTYEFKVDR